MTLPVLRELTNDQARKAQLVLFLYQMDMCGLILENPCQHTNTNLLTTADLKFANFKGYKLTKINFQRTDLRGADLESADLMGANLTSADLSCHKRNVEKWWSWIPLFLPQATKEFCVNLQSTQLKSAILSNANLRKADIRDAQLDGAIILGTDLRQVTTLVPEQLGLNLPKTETVNPPLLCNSLLPENFNIGPLKDRDCGQIAAELHQRFPQQFSTQKAADAFVKQQRNKQWEMVSDDL